MKSGWVFWGLPLCSGLDLAEDALGQGLYGHAGAGGFRGEELGAGLVEGGEIAHVGQEAGGLEDLVKTAARSGQDGPRVLAALLRLGGDARGTSPVAGATGIWPEVKIRPFLSKPWE